MTKVTDFSSELKERYGITSEEAANFIMLMFDVIRVQLKSSDKQVKIKGLGTFKVTAVGSRASVNVNTGERIILDGRNKISFTPEVMLRDRVNRPFAQFDTVILNDNIDFANIDSEFNNSNNLSPETVQEGLYSINNAATNSKLELETTLNEDNNSNECIEEEEATIEQALDMPPTEEHTVDSISKEELSIKECEINNSVVENTPNIEKETPVHASLANENISIKSDADENQEKYVGCKQRNPLLMYWLTASSFFLLLCIGVGLFILYQQVKEKNVAIDNLQKRLATHTATIKKLTEQSKDKVISITKDSTPIKKENNNISQEEIINSTKTSESKPNIKISAPDYNYDVRVRTGAYIIVGTMKTVVVKPGQTLASISKAYLGPGMDCYVEVYNNCKEVNPGDKINIPKLKIKPRN